MKIYIIEAFMKVEISRRSLMKIFVFGSFALVSSVFILLFF